MKRILLAGCLMLCLCSPGQAASWGVLDGNAPGEKPGQRSLAELLDNSLFPRFLARETPVRYCIDGMSADNKYADLLETAYTRWFANTAEEIRRAGRENEFADILPFLEKPLLFLRQNCSYNEKLEEVTDGFSLYGQNKEQRLPYASQPEQIRLLVLPDEDVQDVCAAQDVGGCTIDQAYSGVFLVVIPEGIAPAVLRHELGHTLYMGEGYKEGEIKNSPRYGTGTRKEAGAMNMITQTQLPDFSCDDVDAMIIFSDAVSVPGKPARTGKIARTFQSFCADSSVWYKDGLVQNRAKNAVFSSGRVLLSKYKKNGRLKNLKVYEAQGNDLSEAFSLLEKYKIISHGQSGREVRVSGDKKFRFVNDPENPDDLRVFTLKGNDLLGAATVEILSSNQVMTWTTLNPEPDVLLVRVEDVRAENDLFFVMSDQFRVQNGEGRDLSVSGCVIAESYYTVWFRDPKLNVMTLALVEKNTGKNGSGYIMNVYREKWDEAVEQGRFLVDGNKAVRIGDLSARDEKYFQRQASSINEFVIADMQSSAKYFYFRDVQPAAGLSGEDILDLFKKGQQMRARAQNAVQTHLVERRFIALPEQKESRADELKKNLLSAFKSDAKSASARRKNR